MCSGETWQTGDEQYARPLSLRGGPAIILIAMPQKQRRVSHGGTEIAAGSTTLKW